MSYFFDNHLNLTPEETICTAWSHTEFNMILAVSTNAPKIIFVQEEGNLLPNFQIVRNKSRAVALKWHPLVQALAIGWDDGVLTLWNEDERLTREEKTLHKSPITIITFSNDGSRMVTGDAKGTVGVWRTHRGLTPVCSYSKEGAVTNIVFCSLQINQDANQDSSNSLFFFGGTSGSVCLADDLKNCSEVCKVPGSVKTILFYEKENSVIIITSHLLLVQFKLNLSEKLVPDRKVKLAVAGNPEYLSTIWAGNGLLATVSGENMIRMFNIEQDENYVLTLAESAFQGLLFQDKIVSLSYNHRRRILSGGTKNGYIVMWKCKQMSAESPSTSEGWDARAPMKSQVAQPITKLEWGGGNQQILSAMYQSGVTILNHTILKKKMKDNFKMMQISNKAVEVRLKNEASPNTDYQIIMTLGMNIKGIDCCKSYTLFWNGKFAQIYDVQGQKGPQLAGNFESHASVMALTEDSVIQNEEGNKIQVCSFAGEVKQVIPMAESEGEVTLMDVKGRYMAVVTQNNMIKIFDISRRQYKQIGVTRKFEIKNGEPLGEIKDIQLNCDGKKLCILADQSPFPTVRIPDVKFYIYDVDMDNFMEMEVSPNRVPVECFWDLSDTRLLSIETEYVKDLTAKPADGTDPVTSPTGDQDAGIDGIKKKEEEFTGKSLETFFVTTDYKVKRQDVVKFEEGDETLLGMHVPFFYFMGRQIDDNEEEANAGVEEVKSSTANQSNMIILRRPMKDFLGLENVDEATKKAIMNFSFYLTVGNMDEAYNSVRNIKNNTVWQNMAQMCVKTKRLDVAQVCLGNMRFARGARVVRETEKERELEAKLAMVAIQLNMIDDAKELYKECGRYDLLCKLHQACGEFDEAIEVSEKYNRINLKNTHFTMAKHFESIGMIDDAIRHYIQSETHRSEVPRMLCNLGLFDRLQSFVQSQKEPELYKWWAQYLEAQGLLSEALGFYRLANDNGSVVRLLCSNSDIPSALKLALETNDPQACFHLARHYEAQNNTRDAIVYYSKSQRLHHAIRLAKDSGYDQEVMTMSLQASKPIMVQSAAYFEKKGKFDKAVSLYMRGGNKKKAMDLAMRHHIPIDDFPTEAISGDNPDDQETLQSSVQFLMQNKQYEKAVEVMVQLGNFKDALEMAEKHNFSIKEEFAMKLIPPMPANASDTIKQNERKGICMRLAKISKKQGDFKLGAKLYTMANEKLKGMKCLLKSADVKQVISFATNARQPDVFVLAGNFLQNQNWHNDPEIMKTIISFYQKAKAFESLAGFYDACAQVEIDEYRDYEKALGAMKEAQRQLDKSAAVNKEMKQRLMRDRIATIEKFVQAREAFHGGDTNTMVQLCDSLVNTPGAEEAIRLGDVFAQLVEFFSTQRNYQQAHTYIEKMRKKNIIITPYLDPQIVETVYNSVGQPLPGKAQKQNDGIDEDIQEDF